MKKKSTNRKDGLWTASYGEIGATLKVLHDNGVTLEHLARIRSEPKYAKRITRDITRGGRNGSIHHKHARAIMDINIFGIEDWTALLFKADISQKQFRRVPDFPWSKDILTSICPLCANIVKDCHFAFLGLDRINGDPITILKLKKLYPADAQPRFVSYSPNSWYFKEKFATKTTMDFRWYLLHTNAVIGSHDKPYDEQKVMLPAEYEVPSVVTETAKDLFVFRKTKVYRNPSEYARCADLGQYGDRVVVRYYDTYGLDFSNAFLDCHRRSNVKIAASRKPGV